MGEVSEELGKGERQTSGPVDRQTAEEERDREGEGGGRGNSERWGGC